MTELEKKQKIDLLIQEFKQKADELEKEDSKRQKCNLLDNGKTKYTELYEEYKKKIDEIRNK